VKQFRKTVACFSDGFTKIRPLSSIAFCLVKFELAFDGLNDESNENNENKRESLEPGYLADLRVMILS
jgi:hypothetical protein